MSEDILERAKKALIDDDMTYEDYDECISLLIAEVERLRFNLEAAEAVAYEERNDLFARVERLRSLLEPVKCDADLPVNAIRARDNYYTEILRLEKERNNTESGLLEDIADLSDEITAKDARIKELEADRIAYRNLGSRIEDLETYIERLEAAFLESEAENQFHQDYGESDWEIHPDEEFDDHHGRNWYREEAREALERIKEGGKDESQ